MWEDFRHNTSHGTAWRAFVQVSAVGHTGEDVSTPAVAFLVVPFTIIAVLVHAVLVETVTVETLPESNSQQVFVSARTLKGVIAVETCSLKDLVKSATAVMFVNVQLMRVSWVPAASHAMRWAYLS